MSEIKITQERIDHLMDTAEWEAVVAYGKCLILTAKLENGFILTESSACVDPENFDMEVGARICRKKIENKIWELEGYALQKEVYERKVGA